MRICFASILDIGDLAGPVAPGSNLAHTELSRFRIAVQCFLDAALCAHRASHTHPFTANSKIRSGHPERIPTRVFLKPIVV